MNKKFLITGATGFVGRQIILNLLNKNIKIKVIVRKAKKNFFKNKNIEVIITDNLFNKNTNWWRKQCKGIDTVIHAAWYTEPGKYLKSQKNIECLIGSLNLAKGAVEAGIKRFIGIGTCFEYDLNKKKLSVDTPLKPNSVYGSSKVALFKFLSQWLPEQSVSFSWCRLFYLYGEGEDERRLVPYIHKCLKKNIKVELTRGNKIRDYLNISDAGRIITEISLKNHNGPINVCSGVPISVKQLAQKIADSYGKRYLLKFGAKPDNATDPSCVIGVPNIKLKYNKKNFL